MIAFYLLGVVGLLISNLLNLASFNKATQGLSNYDTTKLFYKQNLFYSIASALFVPSVCFLLTLPGAEWLVRYNSGGQMDGSTPFQVYLVAFLIGLGVDQLIHKIKNLVKANPLDTRPLVTEIKQSQTVISPKGE